MVHQINLQSFALVGYGALGIIFSKLHNLAKVTMVDKDMLSLRYAGVNIEKNLQT